MATVDFYCAKPSENFRMWARGVASEAMVSLKWCEGKPEGLPGPFWGGWMFDQERPWAGFKKALWRLPKQLVWQREGHCVGCGFGQTPEEARASLSQLITEQNYAVPMPPEPLSKPTRTGEMGQEKRAWAHLVKAALEQVEAGALQKLVVARQIHVESEAGWAPSRVLQSLESRFEDCWLYCLRGEGGHFIGATPEVLCHIEGRRLETEALAGTAGLGEESALLHSEKDVREHRWVIEGIVRALKPLSEAVEEAPCMQIRHLPHLIHLRTPICARLREGVLPLEVARAMHPSPAVAGIPTEEALVFLRKQEPFSRGWYAGALGWGNEAELTLFVTLRSARICATHAEVFVGAGIVQGSLAEREWQETERKAQALLHALDVL